MPPPITSPVIARAALTARFSHKAPEAESSRAASKTAVGAGRILAGKAPVIDATCQPANSPKGTSAVRTASPKPLKRVMQASTPCRRHPPQ
jgi:hypothetical protein